MADGSQLRRRVRMATADEPIDNRAIANQAAAELRAQIEASPIGERLERVVEEDRPLASRVASAETPLVEEPDTSPSAREISFHLTQPTGRGAVRSALRTPSIAADLRPRTPFGEDDTGIAPEPTVTAKPERADVDILEPEQPDEPDRSPAGPDRDATAQNEATDELADLHKAQRRDRRMAIAGGVLRGVQALGAILGRVTGAPGLAGLGGMAGVASSVIPQGRAVEAFGQETALRKAQRQDQQRAEQAAYEREQDAIQSKRADAQLGVNMENAETGHRMSQARWEEQQRMNRLAEDEQRSRLDPAHQAAQNARGVFTSFLEAVAREKPELREDFQDVVDSLPNMSASQIESAIDELRILRNAPQGTRRGGRNGGGGGGNSPRPGQWTQPLADPSLEFLAQESFRRAQADGLQGYTIEAARAAASNASGNTVGTMTLGISGLGNQNAEATGNTGTRVNDDDVRRYSEHIAEPRSRYRAFANVSATLGQYSPEMIRAAIKGGDDMAQIAGATDLRAQIYQMLNGYFHDYGGANIVPDEMRRYFAAFGQGSVIGNPDAFIASVRRLAGEAKSQLDDIATGYRPEVISEYNRRARAIRRR